MIMSRPASQGTCPACGKPIKETDKVDIEPLLDPGVRYVYVHWGCSTFVRRKNA